MQERKYLRHPEKRPLPLTKQKTGQAPFVEALKFRKAIQNDCKKQGDVARKFNRPHRSRVSVHLQLLQLPQSVIDYLVEYQHHKGVRRIMTANRLRRILLTTDGPVGSIQGKRLLLSITKDVKKLFASDLALLCIENKLFIGRLPLISHACGSFLRYNAATE